ncbi:hypothetical protein [Prochlorococcus marinus]|nr:hypothetical protein [Prochlorococcus marinus]
MLGRAEINGGIITNMISFWHFWLINFYFAKTRKNGLNARMEEKNLENNL